jgi:hypothetical protein
MEAASHAVMVMFQMQAEPDALQETSSWRPTLVPETERSPMKMVIVRDAHHTPKLKKTTLSVSQTIVETTRSSLGSELALTVKTELDQMKTEEAALHQEV